MGKEIFISKELLIEKLSNIADLAREKYSVSIWFVEILGRRWSYLAGQREKEISFFPPERIKLNDRFGIVSNNWENIPVDERERLISLIKETMEAIYGQE